MWPAYIIALLSEFQNTCIHYVTFQYVALDIEKTVRSVTWLDVVWCPLDFVTPLKKRRLARESLSVDGSLRSISEEDDSLSARTASPPDALPPSDTSPSIDNFTSAVSANECHFQVTLLVITTTSI